MRRVVDNSRTCNTVGRRIQRHESGSTLISGQRLVPPPPGVVVGNALVSTRRCYWRRVCNRHPLVTTSTEGVTLVLTLAFARRVSSFLSRPAHSLLSNWLYMYCTGTFVYVSAGSHCELGLGLSSVLSRYVVGTKLI